jgi:hypothetical protein
MITVTVHSIGKLNVYYYYYCTTALCWTLAAFQFLDSIHSR